MLLKLGAHISNCLDRAANAEDRAQQSADSATRSDNELLAQSWRHLACGYEFVESLERFLSDTTSYKKIPRKYRLIRWNSRRRRKTNRSSGARGSIMKLRSRTGF